MNVLKLVNNFLPSTFEMIECVGIYALKNKKSASRKAAGVIVTAACGGLVSLATHCVTKMGCKIYKNCKHGKHGKKKKRV